MLLAETLRSSTLRYALVAIAVFGVVMFALIGYVYWSTVSFVQNRATAEVAREQRLLDHVYETEGRQGLITAIAQRTADGRGFFLLTDAALSPVVGNLGSWPATLTGVRGSADIEDDDAQPRPRRLRVGFTTLPDGSHLLAGKDVGGLEDFTRKIRIAVAAVSAFLIFLAGVASLTVTRRTVGRIATINATSQAILQRGLGQRIPSRGTRDEWDQLAHNLNLALGRIEELMGEVRQVSDNVAHDLRTPLTRMRARLEKAIDRPRDGARDQVLIGDTIGELDTVLGMFSSLLRISQIEGDNRRSGFRTVDLAAIVGEVVELFDAAAEDIGGRIEVRKSEPMLVTGDRDLLFDAIANVLDNAIKHGGLAGPVTVDVADCAGMPVVSVGDCGLGIPEEYRKDVFKRFYRLEGSRRTPGNGLGLSLVAAVATLHGARIDMLDNSPGLIVRLTFPAVARALSESEVLQP